MIEHPWPIVKLANVTTKVGSGATPPGGAHAYVPSGIPLIRSMNVHSEGFNAEGIVYLNERQASALAGVEVRADDVLLNITGASLGRVTLAPAAFAGARVNQHVCILRPTPVLDARFLQAWLRSPQMQRTLLQERSGATTRQALTKARLLALDVPLPPLREQQRIVERLDGLLARGRRVRELLAPVPSLLERLRRAVLTSAIRGDLTASWRARHPQVEPAFHLLERIRAERRRPLPPAPGHLPPGWAWASIDSVAEVSRGDTPRRSHPAYYAGGTLPWITSAALNTPYIRSAQAFVTPAALNETRLSLLPPGTLLVAMYGEGPTRGRCSELLIEATTNQAVASITLQGEARRVQPWLKLFLHAHYEALRSSASGGAQPNLTLGALRRLCFPLPPEAELQAAHARVLQRLSSLEGLEATLASVPSPAALEQAILERAFGTRETLLVRSTPPT